MDNFTQQLKNLTINNEKFKQPYDFENNNNGPYFDPNKNHVHKWRIASKIKGITHRQYSNQKTFSNRDPIIMNRSYCTICHELKKKPFVVDAGSGIMCGLMSMDETIDNIQPIHNQNYKSYTLEDKYNEVLQRLQRDPANKNLQILYKDSERMLNWIYKVNDPRLYQMQYLHTCINMDYINALSECLKYNDYQNAVPLLWISYTITRDKKTLVQIQSMINGYKQIFGQDLYDYIKEHNNKMKLLIQEINPPPVICNKRSYSETKPKHYWKTNQIEFSKKQRFHGLRPFPKIEGNYVKVK